MRYSISLDIRNDKSNNRNAKSFVDWMFKIHAARVIRMDLEVYVNGSNIAKLLENLTLFVMQIVESTICRAMESISSSD